MDKDFDEYAEKLSEFVDGLIVRCNKVWFARYDYHRDLFWFIGSIKAGLYGLLFLIDGARKEYCDNATNPFDALLKKFSRYDPSKNEAVREKEICGSLPHLEAIKTFLITSVEKRKTPTMAELEQFLDGWRKEGMTGFGSIDLVYILNGGKDQMVDNK